MLVGRNPLNMRGGASTWIINMDPFFKEDFQIDYLILPEKWLNIKFIPDRIKASIQALWVLGMQKRKWDIFISHSPELSYLVTIFSRNLVHIAHGNTNPMANPTFYLGKIFYPLYDFFINRLETKARLLYTVGESRVGYNKLNQPIYHTIKPLSFKGKRNVIFAGRLERIKNIDFIIKAYKLLPEKLLKTHNLHIYGRGGEELRLKKLISQLRLENQVILKGHIPNKDLIAEINKSSLLVMASSFEGFPMVIAEALTVGTPVISTDVGSISGVVSNGYNGFCLSKDISAEVFAQKIEEVLMNIPFYAANALLSSKVFNAAEVYAQIKNDLEHAFPRV